jgi:hypothetical protein
MNPPIFRSFALAFTLLLSAPVFLNDVLANADSILVFNEIDYNPADDVAGTEWIEFHNLNSVNVDISGWRMRGGVDFDFPEGTVVEGHGFLLVAADPNNAKLAGKGAHGPFAGALNNSGESLRIENRDRRVMDRVSYGDSGDWPVGPDGSGATLSKRNQESTDNRPGNWVASREVGGTPGTPNFPLPGAPPIEIETMLVDWDAVWRYNETDDLAEGWEGSAHPVDGNWKSGPGALGWDNSAQEIPQLTELTQPNSNDPFVVTYYFEHEFTLTHSQFDNSTQLQIEHFFDDGGVVYVNGQEVFRHEMPDGVPTSETLSTGRGDADPSERIGVPTASLVAGSNRISVEVHQGSNGSSDVMFGLRVTLVEQPPDPSAPVDTIVFNEFSAHDATGGFQLEITNISGKSVDLANYQINFSEGGAFTFTEGALDTGGFATLDEATLGFTPGNNDRLFLYDPVGQFIDGRRVTGRLRGRSEAFEGRWLYPSEETFGAANTFSFERDIVINEIMYHPRPQTATPDTDAVFEPVTLLDWDALWRANESGADLGQNWKNESHPSGGDWKQGAGPLGWDNSSLEPPIATFLTQPSQNPAGRVVTYYFETDLTLTQVELDAVVELQLVHLIDDGAVFYINGQEVARFEMPDGAITHLTESTGGSDAEIEGPVVVPRSALVPGMNRISVEVHQASPGSSDYVFGMQLLAKQEVSPFIPGEPFRASNATWVEVHNRSADRTLDLSAWRFDDGIDYTFPQGTMLAPSGFLVVAQDAADLAAKHAGVTVLGNFGGGLSRAGERLRLIDANDNPADEVRYADGGRWSGKADGGGSSLELRDPNADNSAGEAWSASQESHRGSWNTYTRTGVAKNGQSDPTSYHEFIFGLLDEGEFLIDDVSVIEEPGTASARELIQNADFSAGDASFWRMRGTHRHFEAIDDPDQLGNKVLHVMASGSTEHMHNCAETTLKDGDSFIRISTSKEYRIQFRARWLSGSNQLNSRLYFNRLPRTDILTIDNPHGGGTPGAANSTREENSGPTFARILHDPAVPAANQTVDVVAQINDPDGVASAVVHYAIDGDDFQQAAMVGGADGLYTATIPGQSEKARAQFYIEAVDALGATSFFPREGAESRAMIPWQDGEAMQQRGSVFPTNLRIVMPDADARFLHTVTEVMSNDRLPCTVIHNEEVIYYGCRVRLKSSQRGRSTDGRVGFNIQFPADNKFLGCHGKIAVDRSGQSEIIVKHMAAQMGNVPGMFDDLAWVIQPRANRSTSAILMKSRFDDEWLDNQFPNGGEGPMFEFELIYHPNGTDGGREGLKRPQPDGVNGVAMRNQGGDDKELYRWHWLIKNNRDADDYSSMIELLTTLGLRGDSYDAAIEDVADVDQWLRTFAFLNLTGIGDNYGTHGSGAWHNAIFYIRPTDGKALFFPWDMDFTFSNAASSGVTPNADQKKMIGLSPAYKRAFYGHLLDMIETTFNTDYMDPWLSHYSEFLQERLTSRSSYIRSRVNTVRNLINRAVAEVPYRVTTASGGSTADSTTTVRGDGWVNARQLRLKGTETPLAARWIDDSIWEVTLPVAPGANTYTIEALGFDGSVVGSDTFSITGTGTVVPADATTLSISEIHYHPAAPEAGEIAAGFADEAMFEWVELVNHSETATLDLGDVMFSNGIEFVIPAGILLAPGERLVLPANAAAFAHRYGDLPEGRRLSESFLIGDGSNKFSNGGERVLLLSATNAPIADFSYSDNRPWPVSADGDGYSLTLMRPGKNDPAVAQSWRSSAAIGGTPGSDDAIPLVEWVATNAVDDLQSDEDGDGKVALLEYLGGTDPAVPDGSLTGATIGGNGELGLNLRQRIGADEIDLKAERSAALTTWSAENVEYWGRENNGDGTETLRFRAVPGTPFDRHGFLRLSVSTNP